MEAFPGADRTGSKRAGLRLAGGYFIVATAWILLSDRAALAIAANTEQLLFIQSIKGIVFVAVMTIAVGLSAARLVRAESERATAQLLARTDLVTGLPNGRAFYASLSDEIHAAQKNDRQCAILLIDFRDFSRINTSFGRGTGDKALLVIGEWLREMTDSREQAARLEEDKFAILVSEVADVTEVAATADRIVRRFDDGLRVDGYSIPLNLNVGYAVSPDDGDHVAALLDAGELALRAAKEAGHNTAMRFRGSLLQSRREHFHLESELRQALANGELSVQFQPQFELAGGALVGAELLARWNHGQLGAISPAVFIPVAEQSGLIDRVGEYVLDCACRTLSDWRQLGLPDVKLAVNVAGHQLDDQRLGFFVMQAAEEWNVPLTSLEIEVTESMAMRDPEHAIEVLMHLREMGISVALDDFGTGYSSLSYLLRLPVDKLKIDRSFISELPHHRQQLSFVRTLVALGKDLGVRLVAEGIETDAQRQVLTELGCDLGQGYLLGRPMDGDAFARLLHGAEKRRQA